jgi:hypothetical protein
LHTGLALRRRFENKKKKKKNESMSASSPTPSGTTSRKRKTCHEARTEEQTDASTDRPAKIPKTTHDHRAVQEANSAFLRCIQKKEWDEALRLL